MTTAELVLTPLRTTQFLSVPFVIGVVPLDPNHTTFGVVDARVLDRQVPRSCRSTAFDPSIVM